MHRAPRRLLARKLAAALLLAFATASAQSRPLLKPAAASSADLPFRDSEWQTEQQLLLLANQSRGEIGAQPLTLDAGLSAAARLHAQIMIDSHQLSHQFDGEQSLPKRLAATTSLQLDREGENLALDYSAHAGHEHLMLSPPHRANLLNPAYNVVGIAVLRSGDRLYIVQDFGHSLPTYSVAEVKDRVANGVNQIRQQAQRAPLERNDLGANDQDACSMAQADRLGTGPVQQLARRFTVMTYTTLEPEKLPAESRHAIDSPNLHSFSVGVCYARTETYPTGVYWIVLSLD